MFRGLEQTEPIWKKELNQRKAEQEMFDMKKRFEKEEQDEQDKQDKQNKQNKQEQEQPETEKDKEKSNSKTKERIRSKFIQRISMEDCDHDIACAIRTSSETYLYQLLSFNYHDLLLPNRNPKYITLGIDSEENHILHYCAYFNSITCFEV